MREFLEEMGRRRVFRTAAIYLAASWVAIEVASTVLPLLSAPSWAPRMVLALAAAGLPVALVLAWRFDIGPSGVDVTEARDRRGLRIGQSALLASAVLIGLTVPTFIVLDQTSRSEETPESAAPPPPFPAERSVAVLPFENGSGDPGDEYFAAGITDELVGALARFDGIRVLHPAASERLLAQGAAAGEAAGRLGAGYALQGSVRRAAGYVRITAVLSETESGAVVWQEAFDSDLSVEDLFEVQKSVAEAVAARFEAEVGTGASRIAGRVPTRSLEAFDRYLRANFDLKRRTPVAVNRAVAGFRSASELDPSFAAALAREAYAYQLFVDWEWTYPGATATELLERAGHLADEALAMDSASAEAWLAVGYAWYLEDADHPERSLPALSRALELNPGDPEIFHQYGQILMTLGRYGEAESAYHGALALDPTRAMTLVPLAAMSHRRGHVGEARRWIDSAVAVGPHVPYAWSYRANVRNGAREYAEAAADARRALEIDPSYDIPARSGLAVALHGLGDTDRARAELERAVASLEDGKRPGSTDAFYLGGALVATGRTDEALALLERAVPSPWLWFYLQHPDFDPVRESPRFRALVESADPR